METLNSKSIDSVNQPNFITRNRPRYKVVFEDEDLEAQAHPKYTTNYQRASLFESQKAEILVSSIVLISLIAIIIYTVKYYRKRRSIIAYNLSANGSSDDSTSNIESDNISGNLKLLRELQEQYEMNRRGQTSIIVHHSSGKDTPNFGRILGIVDDHRIGQKSMTDL